ncbi:MAG: ATP-binding protein [Bacteroides sp.]
MVLERIMPIGEQSFQNLRNDNAMYVDKTHYIYNIITQGRVFFLSRPRRFGKSLLLSTLAAYFQGRKDLFKGLYLEHAEPELAAREGREAWQEHPVLSFSLNAEHYVNEHSLESILNRQLVLYEKLYGRELEEDTLAGRLSGVIRRACEQKGLQVVFLMDEYDKPLLSTLHNPPLHQVYKGILHAFFTVLKDSGDYLRFIFFTGVTRFAKVGIFSGLNNLNDISMDAAMAGLCGITDQELVDNFSPEIDALAAAQKLTREETLRTLKKKYDGYYFSEECNVSVYNPFSLLNTFYKNRFSDYWFATGTPTFLVEELKSKHFYFPDLDDNILVRKQWLENYSTESQDIVPVLLQAGYLSIKEYIPQRGVYRLGFPNDEVRYSFLANLLPIFAPITDSDTGDAVWDFQQAIETGGVEQVMEKMVALLAGVPYGSIDDARYYERDAQVAFYFVFKLLGQFVQTEVHNNKGRADIIVHTPEVIYIFELKLWSAGTPEEAIAQIKEQGYAMPYKESRKKILLVGASFDPEKRNIGAWKAEEFTPEGS